MKFELFPKFGGTQRIKEPMSPCVPLWPSETPSDLPSFLTDTSSKASSKVWIPNFRYAQTQRLNQNHTFFSSKRLIISGCYPTCGVPYFDLDHIIASAFSDNAVRCFYCNQAWGRGSEVPADGDTLVIQFWFQRTHQAYRGLWLVLDWTKNTIIAWASNHDSPCILAWFHPLFSHRSDRRVLQVVNLVVLLGLFLEGSAGILAIQLETGIFEPFAHDILLNTWFETQGFIANLR